MAATSLLALIDDLATLLDDVSVMTKVAAKKTAGLLGDDLAVNAEQVTGFASKRELPVIWAVAKGATINKVILVPVALLLSAFLPQALTPLLMLGGAFLVYEGFHKVHHKLFHDEEETRAKEELRGAFRSREINLVEHEKKKIKGAIRTDFILSAEIIVLALNAVVERTSDLAVQFGTLVAVSTIVVVGVYGLVAGIVKVDDLGLHLIKKQGGVASLGQFLVDASPRLMKGLGIVGTVAMFLVGGGILGHGIPPVEHLIEDIAHAAGPPLEAATRTVLQGVFGVIAGGIIMPFVAGAKKVKDAVSEESDSSSH